MRSANRAIAVLKTVYHIMYSEKSCDKTQDLLRDAHFAHIALMSNMIGDCDSLLALTQILLAELLSPRLPLHSEHTSLYSRPKSMYLWP